MGKALAKEAEWIVVEKEKKAKKKKPKKSSSLSPKSYSLSPMNPATLVQAEPDLLGGHMV